MDRTRARGALVGLAVGDALGTTLEFEALEAPPFPTLTDGPHREIVGGGPFRLPPGQVTDDTQMACCIAASLVEHRAFVADDVARRYIAWQARAFDIGNQTTAALRAIATGIGPESAGRVVWEKSERKPAGNGSLMRTAPIGVFFAGELEKLRHASRADSAITHYDPRCQEACVAFNVALASAIGGADAAAMWSAARAEIESVELGVDLDLAQRDDPDLYGDGVHIHAHQGFVRVAFRLAFWELLHAPSFEAALVDVVNRGGDADTNGAITGALLGAWYGEDAIPARWKEAVLDAPRRDEWHPATLLELVR